MGLHENGPLNSKERAMKHLEVVSVTVHSPAYLTTPEGKTLPYVALELTVKNSTGPQEKLLCAFAPELLARLVPSLAQALTHIHGLPPESHEKH